jgi:hypothetical protein
MPTEYTIHSFVGAGVDTYTRLYHDLDDADGQSLAGDGRTLDVGKFKLAKTGSPTGLGYFKLYESTGSYPNRVPTGSVLATSASIDVSTLPTYVDAASFIWIDLIFSTPYRCADGTYYILVFAYGLDDDEDAGSDINNCIDIYKKAGVEVDSPNNNVYHVNSWGSTSFDADYFYAISYEETPPVIGSYFLFGNW